MLKSIHVKNLALIDDSTVEFFDGLNIISGETGAGKSLLIKSVELILGKKGDKSLIRNGKEFALVELTFDYVPESLHQILIDNDIEDDNTLIISRKISDTKSVARINGETINLKLLNLITSKLISLHGQDSSLEFRNEAYHLELLDMYGKDELSKYLDSTAIAYKDYTNAKNNYLELKSKSEDPNFSKDFLEFEVNELETANLIEGEDDKLENRYKIIKESQNLIQIMAKAKENLGSENGINSILSDISYDMSKYCDIDDDIKSIYDNVSNMDALASDTLRSINNYIDTLDFDDEEIVEIEQRLDVINSLKTKHNTDIKGLIELLESKKQLLNNISNMDMALAQAKQNLDSCLNKYNEVSSKLSQMRHKVSKRFEESIIKEMGELEFLKVELSFEFKSTNEPSALGSDLVSILVSFNPGEPLKPLVDIASGGELSRVMLAVKSALGDKEEMPTMIFDEIDTGISGNSATKVGIKMRNISTNHQVLAITHLGAIVALGDNNYQISKSEDNNITTTTITKLDENGVINEIARILGGDKISDNIINSAKELRLLRS